MKTAEIRKLFLDYFSTSGHRVVPGGPLAPPNDPSLLFTNSGMVQFKDVFLGYQKFPGRRAVTVQPCLRAGGKHNDLENVGYTARHHTFFEMLGNFSFGDYFKKEAIEYAWRLLTGPIGLPPEKLWVTVYEEDDEAARLWLDHIGVDAARFARVGAADNFWSMGDTGPCGPCSEIFYDHGPEVPGKPPGAVDDGGDSGDRYIEIWNLVFMQFNRDAGGAMEALPRPSVDTGMGLERIAAILQGVRNNYDIDLFRNLIEAAAAELGVSDTQSKSLRVIADHLRAAAFLVAEGIVPSNEGRGYVLRRIIRRAIRHGYQLGRHSPFLHELGGALDREMGDAYPGLRGARARIKFMLLDEGRRFMETLEQGLKLLDREMSALGGGVIPGEVVFRLHDTYGFPPDLVNDVARENNLKVDMEGYEQAMQKQRAQARASRVFGSAGTRVVVAAEPTRFLGYDGLKSSGRVLAIVRDGAEVERIKGGEEAVVILDETPFYGESGGQVGDCGTLIGSSGCFEVEDTRHLPNHLIGHGGRMIAGFISADELLDAEVSAEARAAAAANHSATHLLHAALRRVLGRHVQQKGSLVAPARLRFDFSHSQPITREQLAAIENLVNNVVRANHPVETRVMEREQALAAGARALFGEKYEEQVRVVGMGEFSLELCGGTHAARTGDLGLFKITSESGVAAGVRRIEALSAADAVDYVAALEQRMDAVSDAFQCTPEEVSSRIAQLRRHNRDLRQQLESLRLRLAAPGAGGARRLHEVGGLRMLVARFDEMDHKALRNVMDRLRDELGDGVMVLGGVHGGRALLAVSVSAGLKERLHAGRLVEALASRIGGKGGGSATLGQGGGGESGLQEALEVAPAVLEQRLKAHG